MRRKKILYDGIPLSIVIASVSLAFEEIERSEMAERLRIPYSTFSHYLEGYSEMPTDVVIRIKKLTGRSIIEDALRMHQCYQKEEDKRVEIQSEQYYPIQAQKRRKKAG